MRRGEAGRHEVTIAGGEAVRAFVPFPLSNRVFGYSRYLAILGEGTEAL